jgi:hypothetical protein
MLKHNAIVGKIEGGLNKLSCYGAFHKLSDSPTDTFVGVDLAGRQFNLYPTT